MRESLGIRLHGYVFMPNHVHLVLTPPDDVQLAVEIGRMKGRSSRDIIRYLQNRRADVPRRTLKRGLSEGQPAIWQRRCYDHNCRTTSIVREKIKYCHDNPVKRGLVHCAAEWQYSSYNWYCGERGIPVPIDGIEL